ncbi:MAG TPA: SGNH/GDSL hydrolase family protein [Gemmatimonadales bacterium]|nr:SGNH/GDSL hydrolase family protein [Gemmatimonadales bacterium]
MSDDTPSDITRRDFLASAGATVALAGLAGDLRLPAPRGRLKSGSVVLFQGDSITDAGRKRENANPNQADALGLGYPLLIAASILHAHAEQGIKIWNRGVSGNKVPDLAARWQGDTLDLQPDVLSILIGVNDFWHKLLNGYTGTVRDYESGFAALLDQTRAARPGIKLVVIEPFVLHTGSVTDQWFPEFDERRAAARRVAEGAGARFLPAQRMFDELIRRAPPSYWAADGVHPTVAGHGAIARLWLDNVNL